YDSIPEQNSWRRWASGDFSTDDVESALIYREGLRDLNMDALGDDWKSFASEYFREAYSAKSLNELIARVDALLEDRNRNVQKKLIHLLLFFLNVSKEPQFHVMCLFNAGLMPRIRDLAPFAASILRLNLAFMIGLARGFIGRRTSNLVDLEYLAYAPF